ncbi:MAG: ABC transporter substrate-binding protein [Salinivirgaceae bacterium]|nr:MAG: ABC transporter substrate-binding protein [Salinivirgaceae bacterium]
MRFILLMCFSVILVFSCNHKKTKRQVESTNKYARHFIISEKPDYTLITINNPWIDAQDIQYQYAVLRNENSKAPNGINIIPLSPSRIATISTTHIAFLQVLNELDNLKAVSSKQYVYSEKFHQIDSKESVTEVGFDTNLNIEKLLELNVSVVFLYGISNEIEPLRKKLLRAGIIPVMIGEYMEQHPLGKAEWIKVFGAIYNKKELANHYFDSIANEYQKLAQETTKSKSKPIVFTGLPWNDTWHTPGGNTYTAQLIKDAGGLYVFHNDTSSINFQYDLEIVYQRAAKADFWINTGTAGSLNDIKGMDERLTLFKAFANKNVYNHNKRKLVGGGSDYMESGVVKPHLILKDLIQIFNQTDSAELYYYQKLN